MESPVYYQMNDILLWIFFNDAHKPGRKIVAGNTHRGVVSICKIGIRSLYGEGPADNFKTRVLQAIVGSV